MCERVCAKILRPPSHLVEIKSVDYSEAEKMTGVQVVREGDLIAVLHELPDVAERALDTIYYVPNKLTTSYLAKRGAPVQPLPTSAWRAPGANSNTFARESHIDIMAAKAEIDPVEFRVRNLTDEKMIAVIEALKAKFGYTPAKGPSGRRIEMACGTDAGTWVAVMIEVKVDKDTGKVQPLRAVVSQDMGLCVNPQGSIILEGIKIAKG